MNVYAKSGSILEAQHLFDALPVQDILSWTALIAGYSEFGSHMKVLKKFEQMQLEMFSANTVTCVHSESLW